MTRVLQRTPYAGALLTGLLMGIAFPPGVMGALAWIGLVPLLLRLSTGLHWREVVLESLLSFATMTFIVGYWTLFHPMGSARAASAAGLLVLAIMASIPFWMFGFTLRRMSLLPALGMAFGSSAIIEYAQFHTEIGFPWLALGHTQAVLFPINQLAAFFGSPGLTAWVLASNALILSMALGGDRLRKGALVVFAVFLFGSLTVGFVQFRSNRVISGTHTVLAVQPAVSAKSWADVHDAARPTELIRLTKSEVDKDVDLIIWPETSLPVFELRDMTRVGFPLLISLVDSVGVPVLTGAIIEDIDRETDETVYYNSAIVLSPLAGVTGRYDKRIPVPFAERVPYIDRYPWLKRLAVASGGVAGYAAGSLPSRITIDGVPIGVLICFESAFGRAARIGEPESVAYFVVLAQDGWWGDTAGYEQHFAITRLRAIETGRAVMQVTVTGITGLILPDGTTVDETDWMERTARRYKVPIFRDATPYSRFGDLPALLLGLTLCVSGLALDFRVRCSGV